MTFIINLKYIRRVKQTQVLNIGLTHESTSVRQYMLLEVRKGRNVYDNPKGNGLEAAGSRGTYRTKMW